MTAKCVVYCRVSSGSQLDGSGLSSQKSNCIKYAKSKDREVVEVFEDGGVSGGVLERPGIKLLFEFVKKYNKKNLNDKIAYFLCTDIDRLARGTDVHWELKKAMARMDMKLELVNQDFDDTPEGKFVETIMAGYSELFKDKNREKVIDHQEARLRDGYRPFDHPIGFKTITAPEGGKILIHDEPNATIIKNGMEKYANGVFDSIGEVANYWERMGLDNSRREKSRNKTKVKKVHKSAVSRIFNNILYAGYIEYQKTTRNKDGTIKYTRNIPRRKGKHDGLISLETYNKIQEKLSLKRPYSKPQKSINSTYPLRGYLECECCGLKLSSGTSRGNKSVDYYTFNKKCNGEGKLGIDASKLHPKFETFLENVAMDKRFVAFLKLFLTKEYNERSKAEKIEYNKLNSEIKRLKEKMDKYIDAISDEESTIVRKKLSEKVEDTEFQIRALEEKIKSSKNDNSLKKVSDISFEIMLDPLYFRKNGTIDQRRLLLNLLFRKKVIVSRTTQEFGTIELSPLFELNQLFLDNKLQHLEMAGVEPASESHTIQRLLS